MQWSTEHWWAWTLVVAGPVVIGWVIWRSAGKERDKKKYQLPPGPPTWPIIGNLHQFVDSTKLPQKITMELGETYGPVMLMKLGMKNFVFVSGPEATMEVLKAQDHLFANRPSDLACIKYLTYGDYHLTFGQQGEYHNFYRKLMITELLSPGKEQRFQVVRMEEQGLIIREAFEASISSPGASVNLRDLIDTLTINVVTRLAFNKKFSGMGTTGNNDQDQAAEPFEEVKKEIMDLLPQPMVEDIFPRLKWVDLLTGTRQRMNACKGRADSLFQGMLEKHRRELDALSPKELDGYEAKDFIDVVLLLQKKGKFLEHISDPSIKAIMQDLIAAGTDTNGTTLEWAMTELLRNPDVMKKAQDEVDLVVGNERCVHESDVPKFSYLAAVVKETFRLHPPVPWLLPRVNLKDCKVGGYDIPANCIVQIDVYAMSRNPTVWGNASQFNPDRFLTGGKHVEVDVKGSYPQLLPFGGGQRICPGLAFANAWIHSTLAQLIHSFNWSLPAGAPCNQLDISETLTLRKKLPLEAVPTPRLPLHLYDI